METLIGIASLCFLAFLYLIPAYIAFRRGHKNKAGVLILNLALGWTFLGWIIALIWAVAK